MPKMQNSILGQTKNKGEKMIEKMGWYEFVCTRCGRTKTVLTVPSCKKGQGHCNCNKELVIFATNNNKVMNNAER